MVVCGLAKQLFALIALMALFAMLTVNVNVDTELSWAITVTKSSISRALAFRGWSKNTTQQRAGECNADLWDAYFHSISEFCSEHLVFVDESGCDRRIGFRQTGWSPLGVAPVQVSQFHCDQRYQILPAYAQLALLSSAISLNSFSTIVESGPSQNRSWLWTMHLFITLRISHNCALMLVSSWSVCHHTHRD